METAEPLPIVHADGTRWQNEITDGEDTSLPTMMMMAKRARVMTKAEHAKTYTDMLELRWLQAQTHGDTGLLQFVERSREVAVSTAANPAYMTEILKSLALEDLRKIAHVVPGTHNDQKYDVLNKTIFGQVEALAQHHEKTATVLREISDACTRLMLVRNFMEGSTIKWSSSDEEQNTLANVVNAIIMSKVHELGRAAGAGK